MRLHRHLLVLLVLCSSQLAAEVYKWVDEGGKTHYSDKPLGKDAQTVELKSAPEPDPNQDSRQKKQRRLLQVMEDERQLAKQNKAREKAEAQKRKENCVKAQKNLQDIRNASFIYKKSEDPRNPTVFSEEERQQMTLNAGKAVQKWCGDS